MAPLPSTSFCLQDSGAPTPHAPPSSGSTPCRVLFITGSCLTHYRKNAVMSTYFHIPTRLTFKVWVWLRLQATETFLLFQQGCLRQNKTNDQKWPTGTISKINIERRKCWQDPWMFIKKLYMLEIVILLNMHWFKENQLCLLFCSFASPIQIFSLLKVFINNFFH